MLLKDPGYIFSLATFLSLSLNDNVYVEILLQIFDHLGMSWDLRWAISSCEELKSYEEKKKASEPINPTMAQVWVYMRFFVCRV